MKKIWYIFILAGILSACVGSGSGGNSGSSNKNNINSSWVAAGTAYDGSFAFPGEFIIDPITAKLFYLPGLSHNKLCSILQTASITTSWECNIYVPNGYLLAYSLTTDGAGNIFLTAVNDNLDYFVLTYNTVNQSWATPIKISYNQPDKYFMLNAVYYNGNLVSTDNSGYLLTINTITGFESVVNNFFSPSADNPVLTDFAIDNMGNFYYTSSGNVYYKNINAMANTPSTTIGTAGKNISSLSIAENQLFACGKTYEYQIALGSSPSTNWITLPQIRNTIGVLNCNLILASKNNIFAIVSGISSQTGSSSSQVYKYVLQ